MGFLFDGLEAEGYDRQYSDRQLIARIASYFRPQRRRMALVALAVAASAGLDTALPVLIAGGIDRVQGGAGGRELLLIALSLIALASFSWLGTAVRQTLTARAVGDVVLSMRADAIDAVLARDLSFYDQFGSGRVVSRVNSDTQAFSQVIVLTMDLLSRLLLVVLLLGYLFWVSWRLSLVLLVLAPVVVLAALAFRRLARGSITQSRRANAEVSGHIQETVAGIGVAKAFRQEQAIYEEFLAVNNQSRRVNLRTRYVFSGIFPILNILVGFAIAAMVYLGGVSAQAGAITAGEWYLFIQGLELFWFPLTSIAAFWSQFQLGLAAGERVFALIDADSAVVQTGARRLGELRGGISFQEVDFAYRPGEPVLAGFSLDIAPGELVALVGHTGSGKSSLARLIARFYEFQGGRILIDGEDIRALDLAAYRARLGIVTQTPFLFDGTVRENIRYGRPEASDAEVEAAARGIAGGDWIASLPRGLETSVGERGAGLSMGQRQIVALARVLLQDPAIVILDEATASIDPLTEALIQEGLDVVLEARTAIVIAHRLSTVRHADRTIVLRKGVIIEQGSHDALLAAGGHYAELYNTYFRHQSLGYIERRAA
jgi:ATP-binding cassette, subfamily B, bacterial